MAMSHKIRYAIRSLSKDRGFAAMVVLSLAIGIGANTAIFSLVSGVLLRPLDYREPERLVSISQQASPKYFKLTQPCRSILRRCSNGANGRRRSKTFAHIGILRLVSPAQDSRS